MTARKTESWDAFWSEVSAGRTEVIRGVEVRVPTDLPLGYEAGIEGLKDVGEESALEEFEALVAPLFGEGVFQQWYEAGMGSVEFLTAVTWGMFQAKGKDISFRDAYEIVTSDESGKAAGPNRETRRATAKKAVSRKPSASTGGPSKRTSSASTGSARTRSRG